MAVGEREGLDFHDDGDGGGGVMKHLAGDLLSYIILIRNYQPKYFEENIEARIKPR